MSDSDWTLYKNDGVFLGVITKDDSSNTFVVPEDIGVQISTNDILHMDQIRGNKAWEVEVVSVTRSHDIEKASITIKLLGNRSSQYPRKVSRPKKYQPVS